MGVQTGDSRTGGAAGDHEAQVVSPARSPTRWGQNQIYKTHTSHISSLSTISKERGGYH